VAGLAGVLLSFLLFGCSVMRTRSPLVPPALTVLFFML